MQTKVMTELTADLKFLFPVDMTEFNQKTVKVEDYNKERTQYIMSKLPSAEKISQIFNELEKTVEALGYECVKNITTAQEDTTPNIKDFLKSILGTTPPPQIIHYRK